MEWELGSSKSISYTMSGKPKLEGTALLLHLLARSKLDPSEMSESGSDSSAQWRVTIRLERIG